MSDDISVNLHLPQSVFFLTEAQEILYGGAGGGGKSFTLRTSLVRWCDQVPGAQCYLFRRIMDDVKANHLEGPSNLFDLLARPLDDGVITFNQQRATFTWNDTGSLLRLASLEHPGDLIKYQGRQFTVLAFDELTHFTEAEYQFLRSRCRLGGLKVPRRYKGLLPRIESATNPGNIGHAWVKRTWINRAPPYEVWRAPREEGGKTRVFIPAKLDDNPSMLETDPDYDITLEGMGSPALVRAIRDGDWDIVAGQAFESFDRNRHVIKPFLIPDSWPRYRSFDWGYTRPFSVGWWTVANGEDQPTDFYLPRGAVVRYREWYGWRGKADVGLQLTPDQVADGIKEREQPGERIVDSVSDYQIWAKIDGPTVGERMARKGIYFRRADQARTGMKARQPGLVVVNAFLKGEKIGEEDGKPVMVPMLYVFDTCVHGFIRTVPDLVLDQNNPEDLASGQEDHVIDETRYFCMSRPQAPSLHKKEKPKRDRWAEAAERSEQPERPWMCV